MTESATDTPNFSGTWRLIPERSRVPGTPVKQLQMAITHSGPDFIQVSRAEYMDGRVVTRTFGARISGEEFTNQLGNQAEVKSRASWVGQELLIETLVSAPGGVQHLKDYWSLIEGGSKLKMEHRDDPLVGFVGVLERVADAK